jgi:hypothetical protein
MSDTASIAPAPVPATIGATAVVPVGLATPAAPVPIAIAVSGRCGLGTVFLVLAFAVLVAGLTALTQPLWAPELFRLVAIVDPTAMQIRQLDSETARLAAALVDMDGRTAPLVDEVDRLAGTLGAARTAELRGAVLTLAVGQLRAALRRTGSYDGELATVRALASGMPEVERAVDILGPRATTGIPLRYQLRERFPAVADEALRIERGPGLARWYDPAKSMLAQYQWLGYLLGTPEAPPPGSVAAIVQRARARLQVDDMAGAVDELSSLNGQARDAVWPWAADAQARVDADRLANLLATVAIARVGMAARPQ